MKQEGETQWWREVSLRWSGEHTFIYRGRGGEWWCPVRGSPLYGGRINKISKIGLHKGTLLPRSHHIGKSWYVLVCHPYITRMYSYVIRMLVVCTSMSSVCHLYVLICHPYDTRMYSKVIYMSLICTHMPSVCHSYVFVCHQYVTRMYSYVTCMSLVVLPWTSVKMDKWTLTTKICMLYWFEGSFDRKRKH